MTENKKHYYPSPDEKLWLLQQAQMVMSFWRCGSDLTDADKDCVIVALGEFPAETVRSAVSQAMTARTKPSFPGVFDLREWCMKARRDRGEDRVVVPVERQLPEDTTDCNHKPVREVVAEVLKNKSMSDEHKQFYKEWEQETAV